MNACAPDELSKWLSGKLSESPVAEFIPAANLALVTNQIVAAGYKDGRLQTSDMLTWFENEFQVPRETLMPVMSGLKKEAAAMGVTLLLPWETHASAPAAPPPTAPVAPRPAPAARPTRPAPAKSSSVDEGLEFQHLADTRYLERSVYDYIVLEKHPDDTLVARMLVTHFQLGHDEVEVLKTVTIESPGDSLAAWVLRLDGLLLGLHLSNLLVEDMSERQPEWSRGVRQLQTRISETTTALLARQQKARTEQDPAIPLLQTCWNRVRQTADTLDRRMKTLTGKEARPAAPPPPTPRPAAPRAKAVKDFVALDGRRKLIVAGSAVAVLGSIGFCLYIMGVFSPSLQKVEIKLDASGLALPVLESYTEGKAMVAVVDEKAWLALPESGKTEFLLALYDRAVKVKSSQVQVRGGTKILAQAWSHESFKLFTKK